MTTTTICLIAGAVILLIILCAAYDCFFRKPACLGSVPRTPKPPIPRLRTPQAVKGTATTLDTSGAATVMLHLTDGQWVHLATFGSDDAGYNWLCADELAEAIKDSIKQQNTQGK